MRHLNFLSDSGEGKDLLKRATGRFYTPALIGTNLAKAVVRSLKSIKPIRHSTLKVIDPFCGDGRLVQWLLEASNESSYLRSCKWDIELWDCDRKALAAAMRNVKDTAHELDVQITARAICCDSFYRVPRSCERFDVVLTNPPWEVLKPDHREVRSLNGSDTGQYIEALRNRGKILSRLYPLSQPRHKFSGWGTNLARCGTEAALRLASESGVTGIVSPASLLADQISEDLRRWLFSSYVISDIAYYPAEARLFPLVDQPSIAFVALPKRADETVSSTLVVYDSRGHRQSEATLPLSEQNITGTFVLPIHFGLDGIKLLSKLESFPKFSSLEGKKHDSLWAGRELDETGHWRFLSEVGDYMFIKGRMIRRFGIVEKPSKYVSRDGPSVPKSARKWRIGWRDVSRPTQKRRMQATLIRPGWVSGNSISVAYFRDDNRNRLKALLAVMNSLVFEFQVRASLATAHVSLGAVRRARIPLMDSRLVETLSSLTEKCLRKNDDQFQPALEAVVARAYKLTRSEFTFVLSCFDKLENHERKAILQAAK